MRNPLPWLLRLVTRNFGWKVLSLLIAVVLWEIVASEPELSSFTAAPVEFKDLSPELEIASPLVDSVYLELRGASGDLRGAFSEGRRPAVVLDMSNLGPGERTFPIGNDSVKLPRGLHLIRAIPSNVRFEFERRAVRTVPVNVRFSAPPAGYAIADYYVAPPRLRIMGPASHVDRIEAATTDPVDLSRVVGTAEFRATTFIQDQYVRFQDSPHVVVRITMKKK